MNPRYPLVAKRAGHHCEYCRAPEALFNLSFEVEHVVPPRRGGLEPVLKLRGVLRRGILAFAKAARLEHPRRGL
jgi:hypothetical protein